MWILGIIGDIAAGKSTLANRLRHCGAVVIDADSIAREAIDDASIRTALVERFGQSCVSADGKIDRKTIASAVFGETPLARENLRFLESQVHPIVREKIGAKLVSLAAAEMASDAALPTVVALDIPLLIESNWVNVCDEVWTVTAPLSIRQDRARQRGWQSGELERRTAMQIGTRHKQRHSRHVFVNDRCIDQLHQEIDAAFNLGRLQRQKNYDLQHCLGKDGFRIV